MREQPFDKEMREGIRREEDSLLSDLGLSREEFSEEELGDIFDEYLTSEGSD